MSIILSSLVDAFHLVRSMLAVMLDVWFIIFPPLLYFVFKTIWLLHVQNHYASKIKWVMLEIVFPRDIEKSPQPMESIFAGFAGVMKTATAIEDWVKGEIPVGFSLEIACHEGQVHFYIRTQSGYRNLVEAQFYAHYPNIEIAEVPDYVHDVPKTVPNKNWDLWGTDFVFAKDDLYPIKTYKYFEESVTGTMIDPLASVVETMGKAGPGQFMWLQFIITPYKEKWYDTGQATVDEFLGKVEEEKMGVFARLFHDVWDVFSNIGRGLLAQEVVFSGTAEGEKKDEAPVEFRLTPGEKEVLKALQANLGKQMFRTRMRYVYIAQREVFQKPLGVSALIGSIKQFNDFNLNSFKPFDNMKTYANYIFTEARLRFRQRRVFRRYVTRDTDPQSTRIMLSSEELATVFHIPDMFVMAPSISRVAAKRSGAPSNLPVLED